MSTTSFGPSGMAAATQGYGAPAGGQFAYPYPVDRLIRKESALGAIREMAPPEDHIGLKYFPFFEVPHDDFFFDYIKGDATGLAPARAQDAESELAQKDFFISGQGRGSIIDWAIKDHYDPSDVNNFRELENVAKQIQEGGQVQIPGSLQNKLNELPFKIARDTAQRRRRLDNRIEHIIWNSVVNNSYTYNDGKVSFVTPWGRPAGQTNQAPASGVWGGTTHDPINDFVKADEFMYETWGVNLKRAIMGRKIANRMYYSQYWGARTGLITQPGSTPVEPRYLMDGWGPVGALKAVSDATGISIEINDSVYRTRPIGSNVFTNTRYIPDDVIIFLPSEEDIRDFDSSPLGLGKVCTSPHIEGNGAAGFYEWEMSTKDPWSYSMGTGIKMYPIFPHMELTYTMKVSFATS